MIDVLVLVAGTNEPSNCNALADAFIQGMEQAGEIHTEKRRLKDLKIDHFTLDFYDPHCSQEEAFCEIQNLIERSKGLVIATPVWNFSVPAHLKNLIDRIGSFALDETRNRGTLKGLPFFLLFTGGASAPAWALMRRTTSHLPESLQYFDGSYIGHHFEPKCVRGRGKFGIVVDERPESLASVRSKGSEFANVVKTFAETGKAPIKNRARRMVLQWGEAVLKKIS